MEMKNKNILLVEDNPTIQGFHAYLLSNLKYQVDLAITGQAAFTFFCNNTYHAILMDIGLPDMTGIEVIGKIRAYESRVQQAMTPIIVVTAYDTEEIRRQCEDLQVQTVINKPLNLEYMQELLSECGLVCQKE
jgi:two-component system KDP operon response regulator KdpE